MNWLVLITLAAAPLDDVAPLHQGAPSAVAAVTASEPHPGKTCAFEKRSVKSDLVAWQWVAHCPAEDVRLASVGAQVAVRLYTQQSHWTVLALDATRAVDLQEQPEPTAAPPWVSRPLLARVLALYQQRGTVLAHDERDGSDAVQEWSRGYERVTPSALPTGPTRAPLFSGPTPPDTPVRAVWFGKGEREPWLFYAEDPWRRVDFWLRAPGGASQQVFSRPAREHGGSYRVEDLTHVTTAAGEVFSVMVDRRHLVLWPKADGTFTPRVAGVALTGQTPTLTQVTSPPCAELTQSVHEESVNAPRLFRRGDETWAAWLTGTTDTRWRIGPVLKLGAKDARSCEWILDGRVDHQFVTLGRFTADGQLVEQVRLPTFGAPGRLQLAESAEGVTIAAVAMGHVTVTRLKP